MIKNLIETDAYHLSGIEVFQFPGGEWHANVPDWQFPVAHIEAHLRTWDDVGKLLVVANALDTQGVEISLFVPYFPGMRQDRNPYGLTPLTVSMMADVLALVSDTITIVDPHSDAGLRYLAMSFERVRVIDLKEIVAGEFKQPTHVIIPDEGAVTRSTLVANVYGVPTIQAKKVREFKTGKLLNFTVGDIPADAERLLIPDDICDGGGTFVGLLEEIRRQTDAPVDLYVTHGIFSKGLQILSGFDRIYTTDSFYQPGTAAAEADANDIDIVDVRTIKLLPHYFGGLTP